MNKVSLRFGLIIFSVILFFPNLISQTQYEVSFFVDMTYAENFDPQTDDVYITGNFTGWVEPGTNSDYMLEPTENDSMLYTTTLSIDSGEIQYKYFRIIGGPSWDYGEWPGNPNRIGDIISNTTINDVFGVIPTPTFQITFEVDMTDADPFYPETDDVYITGTLSAYTMPGIDSTYLLAPIEPGSLIYSVTLPITEGIVEYRYYKVINNYPSWDFPELAGQTDRLRTVSTDSIFSDIWNKKHMLTVTFEVDMTYAAPFNPENEDVYISGSFANWPQPGTDHTLRLIPKEPGSLKYRLTKKVDEGEIVYKYFRVIDDEPSWDYGEWVGDPNRIEFISNDIIIYDIWGDVLSDVLYTRSDKGILVFPNPAYDIVNVGDFVGLTCLSIFDFYGNEVVKLKSNLGQLRVPIHELNTGNYIIVVHDEKGIHTRKFIKY